MKCLLVLPMLFIVVLSKGNDCDRQSINIITANPNCREGQSIVDQVLELCDANGDAMVSVDEVKDCEVCNISI